MEQQAALLGCDIVLALGERLAAVDPSVLVHDQEVPALERVGDLPGDQLVCEFLGRLGVLVVEFGLGEHLGGEPHEPEVLGLPVQNGEGRVFLADIGQVEEAFVAVDHVGQESATRGRQARYGIARVG
ncbi:hypothetical protein ACFVDQ_44705 [Streptomyces sp. NPDC057684]|uniref:hypothetical protein n=1 Tax=Streptomyces sp. NPDC057684 TaxID=3346211 RepID=UPI0036CEF3DB